MDDRSRGGPDRQAGNQDEEMLDLLQRETFPYFLNEADPKTGLVRDSTHEGSPCSIAALGLALASYPVGVERKLTSRAEATRRTLTALRFLQRAPQGKQRDATGYKGFFYHFLDMSTGKRCWRCELSTIDTALLLAGVLTAAVYFDEDSEEEGEIRSLARELYERVDWAWAMNGGSTLSHGWTPERGFLPYRWEGYSEALILYALALGSPTHPIPPETYAGWCSSCSWKTIYGQPHVYAGPLFIHQVSHMWIDFRGIQDRVMRERGLDYFENSRRATYVHQQYAIRNPLELAYYGETCWGLTACDGPGLDTRYVDGVHRLFYNYFARGAPYGPDDGTIAPWAAAASLPFAPEIVLPTIRYFINEIRLKDRQEYGFEATFNGTYPDRSDSRYGWVSPWILGLNEGPIILMIENYRTEMIWRLMKGCAPLVEGLRRAGFSGGWL